MKVDRTKLGYFDRTLDGCQVVDIPAGATPKFISVQLPGDDAAVVAAWWRGNPPGLAVSDYIEVRYSPTGQPQYMVTGTSLGTGTASVILASVIEDKGDLIVGAGAADPARLPVGTDGYVLKADSGETLGVKWAASGSGDVAGDTHAAASKATPVDADELPLVDSAASWALKKLTWANLKATLQTWLGTLLDATAVTKLRKLDNSADALYVADSNGGLTAINKLVVTSQIATLVTTGTVPLTILSTTKCDNLNADLLDGYHATEQPGGVWLWRADGLRVNYADFDAAYTAAGAGDTIRLFNGTYSFTASKTIGKAIIVKGSGPGTIITSSIASGVAFDVDIADTVTFQNLVIRHTGGGTDSGVFYTDNATIVLDKVLIEKTSGGPSGTGYGAWLNGGALTMQNAARISVTSGGNKYGVWNDAGNVTITVGTGCEVGGSTADIYGNQSGSTLNLNNCILTNAIANFAGTVRGLALDQYGRTLRRVPAGINAVRLTLTSGTPITTSNVTGASTVYATPYKGSRIEVYNGYFWIEARFAEISASVPATKYRLFDVFAYDNAGTLALETVNWNLSTAAITGATNATPIVVTSNGHGLSVGDIVAIDGVLGNTATNGKWYITAVTANTFTLGGSVGNGAYTSGGIWYKLNGVTRATALALQDGRYTKSGDATRLYLGTARTDATSGQTSDTSAALRLLWNYFNRERKTVTKSDSTSHSYDSTTRPWNNIWADASVEYIVGVIETILHASLNASMTFVSGGSSANIGIGSNLTTLANIIGNLSIAGTLRLDYVEFEAFPTTGFNWVSCTESGGNTGADPTFNNFTLTVDTAM